MALWLTTRDFRIEDNLTLYYAMNKSKSLKIPLFICFRLNNTQVDPKQNPYYSKNGFQFMIQSLKQFPFAISVIEPSISDNEFCKILQNNNVKTIFIARDFTPFARIRVKTLQTFGFDVIEIDDITLCPIKSYKYFNKLAPFISYHEKLLKDLELVSIDQTILKKIIQPLIGSKDKSVFSSILNMLEINKNLVQPSDLDHIWKDLDKVWEGYSDKKVRESLSKPAVSYLSAFIKFGLVSVRQVYLKIKSLDLNEDDIEAISRELWFRDFFYTIAFYKPEKVYHDPNWQSQINERPRFIYEKDLLAWKQYHNESKSITESEKQDIKEAKQIFDNWKQGKTEYPIINAGMIQLNTTGYMLNRLRMLTTSYLTRDYNLWWKYPEMYFAQNLTDYDWTINAMNHQNIAKVGPYAKWTQDFSIEKQQNTDKQDKKEFQAKYLSQ